MRSKKFYACLLISAMLIIVLTGCSKTTKKETPQETQNADQETEQTKTQEADATEEAAAGITFEALDLEGNTVTESVFSDTKLTMVNVWATYCNPCLSELPELGELVAEYDAAQFQIIGIVSDVQEGMEEEAVAYASSLVSQTGAAYPHLLLNESLFYAMLSEVSAVPTTFFIDEKGVVLDTVVGARDKDSWKEMIDELLEE